MKDSSQPTPSFAAWICWGIAALFVLYQFLLQASTSVMIPCLEKSFGISVEGVGFLSSSFFYTYLVMQIPAGILIDRFGARRILTLGVAICALATFAFAQAGQLSVAEFSRLVMGFVTAPAVAGSMYLAANWFPAKRFAMIAGLTEMLGMLGGAIGEAYLAQCVGSFGWRRTLVLCAIAGAVLAVATGLFVRNRPKNKPKHAHHQTRGLRETVLKPLSEVMKRPQAWLNGLFAGCAFALVTAFASLWSVPFLQTLYNVDLQQAALASSMVFFGVAAGTPLIGWISDRQCKRKPIMLVSSLLCLLLSIIIIYLPGIPFSVMFVLLFALGLTAGTYVIPFAIMREITPSLCRGTAMGFINMMCILIGSPILQPLIGFLLKIAAKTPAQNFTVANYQLAFSVLPITLLLAVALWPFIRETHCEEQCG